MSGIVSSVKFRSMYMLQVSGIVSSVPVFINC